MAKNKDLLELEGVIVDILPNQTYKVELSEFNRTITCYTSGKMRKNQIRLVNGDNVKIEMSPYDMEKGRITFRI